MKKALFYLSCILLLGCATPKEEPAGFSYTGQALREDVTAEIASHESLCILLGHKGMPPGGGLTVAAYEATIVPKTPASAWEEIWTIQREGYTVQYEIRFIPLKEGGYRFAITALFDEDDHK